VEGTSPSKRVTTDRSNNEQQPAHDGIRMDDQWEH